MRVNGWIRLWIFLSGILLLAIAGGVGVFLPTASDVPDSLSLQAALSPEARAQIAEGEGQGGVGVRMPNGHTIYLKKGIEPSRSTPVLAEYASEIERQLLRKRVHFVVGALGVWLGICGAIYALGWSFRWVYRGFKGDGKKQYSVPSVEDPSAPVRNAVQVAEPTSSALAAQSGSPPAPQAPVQAVASIEPIWNPLVIVFWSLFFGPVWGMTLAWINWKRLGDAARARTTSRYWVAIGLGVTYATNKAASDFGEDDMTGLWMTLAFLWGYILLWALVSHRVQIKQVNTSFGASYPHRSWLWPIVIGVGLNVLFGFLQYWQAQVLASYHTH